MTRIMKTLRRTLLVVVLLLVVAGVVVYLYLDSILKSTVETQATDSLNLTTTLDSAHLAIFGGEVTLKQLQVASPQGFAAEHMLGLGRLNVAVKYGQLGKDPIHIQSINIDSPRLVIEQVNNKVNFKVLMDQQSKTAPPPTPAKGEDRPKGQPIRVVIEQMDITNAQVVIRPGLPGLDKEITIPIPSIAIKNIGNADGADNGAAMKDVVMQVVTALANKASESGALSGILRDALKANVQEIAGKLNKEFQKQIGGITTQLGNVTDKLPADLKNKLPPDVNQKLNAATQKLNTGDVQKSIDKGLGGLLGGDKKKKDK